MRVNNELIQNYIKDNNLTLNGFCRLCKISPASLSKIFEGDYKVRLKVAVNIANYLNIRVGDLFVNN